MIKHTNMKYKRFLVQKICPKYISINEVLLINICKSYEGWVAFIYKVIYESF